MKTISERQLRIGKGPANTPLKFHSSQVKPSRHNVKSTQNEARVSRTSERDMHAEIETQKTLYDTHKR